MSLKPILTEFDKTRTFRAGSLKRLGRLRWLQCRRSPYRAAAASKATRRTAPRFHLPAIPARDLPKASSGHGLCQPGWMLLAINMSRLLSDPQEYRITPTRPESTPRLMLSQGLVHSFNHCAKLLDGSRARSLATSAKPCPRHGGGRCTS